MRAVYSLVRRYLLPPPFILGTPNWIPPHHTFICRYAKFLGMERGDRKGAMRLLKKALHLEPDNAATRALLGDM
jgi:hypothetical protein